MLSAAELLELQADQLAAMDKTAVITSVTKVNSALGQTPTTSQSASIPCRVAPYSRVGRGDELVQDLTVITSMVWAITFPVGTDVNPTDTILVDGTNTYEVISPIENRSYEVAVRVACLEVL